MATVPVAAVVELIVHVNADDGDGEVASDA